MDSRDKVEAQTESVASIPVPVGYYFQSLQAPYHVFSVQSTLLSLNNLKSCFLPLSKAMEITSLVALSTTT
jgi:hypothetical protein